MFLRQIDWKTTSLTVLVAAVLLSTACDQAVVETRRTAPALDAASSATLAGKVLFVGKAPERPVLMMDAVPGCARQHPKPALSEEVIVNANGTLRNAFVWIQAGLPDYQWPTPAQPVVLDQKGCIYEPHVLGVMVNQPVEILNNDPSNHNIHGMGQANPEFNESQPPKTEPRTKTFARPEVMMPVKCNVHPWMRAYIGVVPHPFFAVTGDDGSFTLRGIPPGEYTLRVWHEKYGTQEINISLKAGDSKTANFTVKG